MKSIIFLSMFSASFSEGINFGPIFQNVVHENVIKLNVSSKCSGQLKILVESLRGGVSDEDSLWAWKMIDATSKIQSGILEGNMGHLGAFDECIRISADTSEGKIRGRYCLGTPSFKKPEGLKRLHERQLKRQEMFLGSSKRSGIDSGEFLLGFQWAGCLPDGCTGEEMAKTYAYVMEEYLGVAVDFDFPNTMCQTDEEAHPKLSTEAIGGISIFSAIVALMCISTLYDLYLRHTKSEPSHLILVAFSVYTNGDKLFTINPNNPDQLPCLNGLRVISMMWVILGHQYSSMMTVISNGVEVIDWMDSLHSMYVVGATVAVDTFFLLSGLLMVYGFLKAMSKGVQFNVPMYWLHRYLRLTPALAAVVLLDTTLTEHLGSGPMWPIYKMIFLDHCKSHWWSALLYIQNYVNSPKYCVVQTWYLSVDMQLSILSPLILIPLWRWKQKGLAVLLATILVSIAIPFGIAWHYNLAAMFNPFTADTFMSKYYYMTHTRATPWLIGIFLGYVIFNVKKRKSDIKLNKMIVLFLWIASLSVLITCVFGGHSTLRGEDYQKWPQVSHVVFVRPAWAIALSWLIFACVTGYGGPINWILSFPIYQVLARLTYSVYLLHLTVVYTKVMSSRLPSYFSDYDNLYLFWGLSMTSCALSVVWVLAFESPMIVIEKVIFGKADKPKATAKSKTVEEVKY